MKARTCRFVETMRVRRLRRRVILGALAATVIAGAVGSIGVTSAAYIDRTYAQANLHSRIAVEPVPVAISQAAASTLFLDRWGGLYLAGNRVTGDGAGSTGTAPTSSPTTVTFPDGTRIVDAIASSDNFDNVGTTSYAALDSTGQVWTWGQPWGGAGLIGRGSALTSAQAATPGVVPGLPKIVSIARTENQFSALDADGGLWAWGYGGENLPLGSRASVSAPAKVTATAAAVTAGDAACTAGNTGYGGTVTAWHSVWTGKNQGAAVGQNGLIYMWGFDVSDGVTSGTKNTVCPAPSEGANRALFAAYPDLYKTASGETFDPAVLTTETARHDRYLAIVADMKDKTLGVCASVKAGGLADTSACPVRQLAPQTLATALLLQNGQLYTWVSYSSGLGNKFLGRTTTPVYTPGLVTVGGSTSAVDRLTQGISSMQAVTRDGRLYGWGDNNLCQAIGAKWNGTATTSDSCAVSSGSAVTTPQPVAGVTAPVSAVWQQGCSSWATTATGDLYGWGGGTVRGSGFSSCILAAASFSGYSLYSYLSATAASPLGVAVTPQATGSTLVRGKN